MSLNSRPNVAVMTAKLHNRRITCVKFLSKDHFAFTFKNLMSRKKYDSYKNTPLGEKILRETVNYVLTTNRIDLTSEAVQTMYNLVYNLSLKEEL